MEKNIVQHTYKIGKEERRKLNDQNSILIFFTGLSGSGKSTLANALEQRLYAENNRTYVLDGDNMRSGLNSDLTFKPEDRSENIRRIAEISKLFIDAGVIILAAFIAPYRKDREVIRTTVGADSYVEVFVNTSLEVCEQRDVKGLYAKARKGEITNMTGVTSPYEEPLNPDVEVSNENSIEESVDIIYNKIKNHIRLKKDE